MTIEATEYTDKFDIRYRGRRSVRLKGHDYASAGAYFITICTQNRACLFGEITRTVGRANTEVCPYGTNMILNDAGKMVADIWRRIPAFYPGNDVDSFVVMPNHVHGIIIVRDNNRRPNIEQSSEKGQIRGLGQTQGFAPTEYRNPDPIVGADPCVRPPDPSVLPGTPGRLSLPAIVQRFKSLTTKRYIIGVNQMGWGPFDNKLWQRNYYEHIIRDDNEFNQVKSYIFNNPENWQFDLDNPDYE